MNLELREFLARTQVPKEEFTECPEKGCSGELGDELEIRHVEVAAVELYCSNCHRFNDITTHELDRTGEIHRSAREIFEEAAT